MNIFNLVLLAVLILFGTALLLIVFFVIFKKQNKLKGQKGMDAELTTNPNKLRIELTCKEIEVGTQICNKRSRIYSGVWKDPNRTPVALKCYRKNSFKSIDQFSKEIHNECDILRSLSHPNILICHGLLKEMNEFDGLVLERMERSLLDYLNEKKNAVEQQEKAEIEKCHQEYYTISIQLAHALIYLESQLVVHGDISARNCLIAQTNNTIVAKLADFGSAKRLKSKKEFAWIYEITLWNAWESVENKMVDEGSDAAYKYPIFLASEIWSFGATLLEVFTCGIKPYGNLRDWEQVAQAIPEKQKRNQFYYLKTFHTDQFNLIPERVGRIIARCFFKFSKTNCKRINATQLAIQIENIQNNRQ